ncbi:hypothetical protein IT413_02600 [Candidatus Peregrinibacteria bacterium]|nr:hypothetical protein [Candidatus Peregrinibacteria bacterium]
MKFLKKCFGNFRFSLAAQRVVFAAGGEGMHDDVKSADVAEKHDSAKEGTSEYYLDAGNRKKLYERVWQKVDELEKKGDDRSVKLAQRLRKFMQSVEKNNGVSKQMAAQAEKIHQRLSVIADRSKGTPLSPEEADSLTAWLDQQLEEKGPLATLRADLGAQGDEGKGPLASLRSGLLEDQGVSWGLKSLIRSRLMVL